MGKINGMKKFDLELEKACSTTRAVLDKAAAAAAAKNLLQQAGHTTSHCCSALKPYPHWLSQI